MGGPPTEPPAEPTEPRRRKPPHDKRHDVPFPDRYDDPLATRTVSAVARVPSAGPVLIDGWIVGPLPGVGGRSIPVIRHARAPVVRLRKNPPNPVLHTTERSDDGFNPAMAFPPQFGCANGTIFQLFPVWAKGYSLDENDDDAMQIENGGRSREGVWLPPDATYHPLVALAAFLHANRAVTTFLRRPTTKWPVPVDRPPGSGFPASDDYYRRKAGLWPGTPGVYQHLESPGDEHWDAGGFNFPVFFRDVATVVGDHYDEEDGVEELDQWWAGWVSARDGEDPPGDDQPKWFRRGYRAYHDAVEHGHKAETTVEPIPRPDPPPDA